MQSASRSHVTSVLPEWTATPHSKPEKSDRRSTTLNQLDETTRDELQDLLRLIANGIGSARAYVLIAQTSWPGRSGRRPVLRWRRVSWMAGEEDRNPPLPTAFTQFISSDEAGEELAYNDEYNEVLVGLNGAERELLGYLGIEYPADGRPSLRRIRLLQDIVCSQLKGLGITGIAPRNDRIQASLSLESNPSLVFTQGQIRYANKPCTRLLGGPDGESVCDRQIDDFFSAHESQIISDHLEAVLNGEARAPVMCTVVGLDGTEKRVKAVCRRIVCDGMPSVEVILEPVTNYRSLPDPLIESISEAVWHVHLHGDLKVSSSRSSQVRHISREGVLVESNKMLADYYGVSSVEEILGCSVRRLVPIGSRELIDAFIRSNYNLRGFEYRFRDKQNRVRLFSINAMGTVEAGCLTHIWGSCHEISDRLEFEKKSVSLQEEQKQRIGRDLHDSVAPLLTGMRLLSGDLIDSDRPENAAIKGKIEKLAGFVDEATERLSEIYRGLVPRNLEGSSLAEAIQEYGENMRTMSGVEIRVSCGENADVHGRNEKVQLYRIVQEAVNNALKHADPFSIDISLRRRKQHIHLEISDDGEGFDPEKRGRHSLGLENMRLRAASINAKLSISTALGRGTSVSVSYIAS